MAEAIGRRLHSTSNAFTTDDPVYLMSTAINITNSPVSLSSTRGQDLIVILPISFETAPLPCDNIQVCLFVRLSPSCCF